MARKQCYDAFAVGGSPSVRVPTSVLVVMLVALGLGAEASAQGTPASLFERYLEALRVQAGIPGMSAAIVQEGKLVWERGFGLRDVEATLPALPDTPYHVVDLSETLSAALLAQCVERGTLSWDAPLITWTPELPESGATVRQVLAHASNSTATPGPFKFEPVRYSALTPVIESCLAGPYRRLLADGVLTRLAMTDAVPGQDLADETALEARALFEGEELAKYATVLTRLATPYKVDKSGKATRSEYPTKGLNAATGLIASSRDLARFDAALDEHILVAPETTALAWSNVLSPAGKPLPTGLGWFVQTYQGERVVWQFGVAANAYSSMVVKVPSRRLTLILLANSDGLSTSPPLSEGDLTSSPFARLFLKFFL
jgi:CubicO group peptidase (beta-lactamase class C family)